MAQVTLATKTALTVSGTTGPNLAAAGRDVKGILAWRDLTNANPLSQAVLTQDGHMQGSDAWKSTTIFKTPIMESISTTGSSSGYLAAEKVADNLYLEVRCTRPGRMANAPATTQLEILLSLIANNASLKQGLLGFLPADS
jgi:hypothetical protein